MKFLYEYRTPDNAKHSGVIRASDREAAYAMLKKQGIKPSRFAEAPGFFNKLFGKGKRWLAIGFLGASVLVALFVIRSNRKTIRSIEQTQNVFDSSTRRQIIGDAAIIEKGIRTGWADVFTLEGDRFLASFAIPGEDPAVRSTTEERVREALDTSCAKSEDPDASLEARQIRAIVSGMKQELREYLAAGGTIAKYGRRIVRRQEDEIGYYRRVKGEIDAAAAAKTEGKALEALLDECNAKLRRMGIHPIVFGE